jgi:hypothetical protein
MKNIIASLQFSFLSLIEFIIFSTKSLKIFNTDNTISCLLLKCLYMAASFIPCRLANSRIEKP